MDALESFRKSVELCNSRSVILEEYQQYAKLAEIEFEPLWDYKQQYFNENAPKALLGTLAAAIGLFGGVPLIMMILGTELFAGIYVLICIIMIALLYNLVFKKIYYKLHEADFDKYVETQEEYRQMLPEIMALRDETKERLERHEAIMRDESICIIPKRYWHVANELYSLVINKRAIDIVSAINKYEDIQHQNRLEGMAAKSLAYNEMTMYAAEQARINSEIAAQKAGEAAFVSKLNLAYTFFNDKDE